MTGKSNAWPDRLLNDADEKTTRNLRTARREYITLWAYPLDLLNYTTSTTHPHVFHCLLWRLLIGILVQFSHVFIILGALAWVAGRLPSLDDEWLTVMWFWAHFSLARGINKSLSGYWWVRSQRTKQGGSYLNLFCNWKLNVLEFSLSAWSLDWLLTRLHTLGNDGILDVADAVSFVFDSVQFG